MAGLTVPKAGRATAAGLVAENLAEWAARGQLAPLSRAQDPNGARPLFTGQFVIDPDGELGMGVVVRTNKYTALVIFRGGENRFLSRAVPHAGGDFS